MLVVRGLLCALTFGLVVGAWRKIGDGWVSPRKSYSYVVSLEYNGKHVCTGAVIDKNWILTAGHCLYNRDVKKFVVTAGSLTWFCSVRTAVIHPNYTNHVEEMYHRVNDIGLVGLGPLLYSKDSLMDSITDYVQPIALPRADIADYELPAKFVGWGNKELNCTADGDPHSVDMMLAGPRYCAKLQQIYVDIQAHICTVKILGNQGEICPCDDGGPLVVDNELVGLALEMTYCTRYNIPVTRVWHYIDWINDVMNGTASTPKSNINTTTSTTTTTTETTSTTTSTTTTNPTTTTTITTNNPTTSSTTTTTKSTTTSTTTTTTTTSTTGKENVHVTHTDF